MREMTIYQIDAFAKQVFKGNPAAVVPLDEWLPDAVLQNIAFENNLAETAFFVQNGDAYELRWFTPNYEAPLCGHATLASAYVLFNELGYTGERIHFKANLADLFVRRDGDLLVLDFPVLKYEVCTDYPETLMASLGGKHPKAVYIVHDDPNYFAIYDDETDVIDLQPNLTEMATLHPYGVVVSAPSTSVNCVSRCFAPSYGIPEDPVTGSIHCVLVPYWAQQLNKPKIHAIQASERGGELFCELLGDRVHIAGYATKYLVGTIYV